MAADAIEWLRQNQWAVGVVAILVTILVFAANKRRWRLDDSLKGPSLRLLATKQRREDGWCHLVWHVSNNADFPIIVERLSVVRPWWARLALQADLSRGDHLTAPLASSGGASLRPNKVISGKQGAGGDVFLKTSKSVAMLRAHVRRENEKRVSWKLQSKIDLPPVTGARREQ
jgi:hypothetical protein